jgi:hypothetical protein
MRKKRNLAFLTLIVSLSLVTLSAGASWGPRDAADEPADATFCGDVIPDLYPGDYNGDGRFDLGVFWPDNNSFDVLLSTKKDFTKSGSGQWVASNTYGNRNGKYYPGDFNGDGKWDLGFFDPGNNSFHVSISTGERFGGPGSGRWLAPGAFGHSNGQFFVAYFNGGLKADLGFFDATNNTFHVTLSTGDGFNAEHSGRWLGPGQFGHANGRYYVGDFNNDGSDDLLFFDPTRGNSVWVSTSDGESFNNSGTGLWAGGFGHAGGQHYVGDYNGDGRADLGFFEPTGANANSFHVAISNGIRFTGEEPSGMWVRPNTLGHGRGSFRVADYNNGGKADLGFFNPDNRSFYVGLSNGSNGFNFSGSGYWAHFGRCYTYAPLSLKRR